MPANNRAPAIDHCFLLVAVGLAGGPVASLPAQSRGHWSTAQRAPTLEEARERYALSVEELRAWERDLGRHGLHGLRATRVQIYRQDKKS